MYIKNSFKILSNNLNLTFKAMFYRLVVITLSIVFIFIALRTGFTTILESAEMTSFIESIKATLVSVLHGNLSLSNDIAQAFSQLIKLIYENVGSIIGSLIGVVVVLYVTSVLLGVCNYTCLAVVNSYMSSISKEPFLKSLFMNLKKSIIFESIFALVKGFVFLIVISGALVFVIYTMQYLSVLSLFIAMWLIVLLLALFFTATAMFRPSIVNGSPIKEAFYVKVTNKEYLLFFASYVFVIFISIFINVAMFVATFGAGFTVSMELTHIFFVCLQTIMFYVAHDKKYYIDFNNIVVPRNVRTDDSKFIDDTDI